MSLTDSNHVRRKTNFLSLLAKFTGNLREMFLYYDVIHFSQKDFVDSEVSLSAAEWDPDKLAKVGSDLGNMTASLGYGSRPILPVGEPRPK